MPSLRQILAVIGVWVVVAWAAAAALSLRLEERSWWEAVTWYYSLRAPLVATVLAVMASPMLCKQPGEGWIQLRFPRRDRLARMLLWVTQSSVVGLLVGTLGTFLLLFLWPNDAQNQRIEAYKWAGFYWYNHPLLFAPATLVGGLGSSWLARRLEA